MKRVIKDLHVEKVKQMLSQSYKVGSIKDIMKLEFGVCISSSHIQSIKKIESYIDVRPDLNDKIRRTYSRLGTSDTETIRGVKFALTEGYSNEEIIKAYKLTAGKLTRIRLGHMPFYSIAPEYNNEIEEKFGKKKDANIDNKMVLDIKKEFVDKNGEVLLREIAGKHKITTGAVSTILSMKYYKEIGTSYNSKIISIRKKKEKLKKEKNSKKIKMAVEKEKRKSVALKLKQKQIKDKIKKSKTHVKNLRALA